MQKLKKTIAIPLLWLCDLEEFSASPLQDLDFWGVQAAAGALTIVVEGPGLLELDAGLLASV